MKTQEHGNVDALSRLPVGEDTNFDQMEEDADLSTVFTISIIDEQLQSVNQNTLKNESMTDNTISTVIKYMKQGGPKVKLNPELQHFKRLED